MRALKKLRLLLDIGQVELASAAGLSARQLARIEAGKQLVNQKTAQGLDAALDSILGARISTHTEEVNGEEQG
jgi:transcriptional regulator with XRE-family HTH domain